MNGATQIRLDLNGRVYFNSLASVLMGLYSWGYSNPTPANLMAYGVRHETALAIYDYLREGK